MLGSAIDIVERFQGVEPMVILVSATESNRRYLLAVRDFLLDPRRLSVAMSRAREKLILASSRSHVIENAEETSQPTMVSWVRGKVIP